MRVNNYLKKRFIHGILAYFFTSLVLVLNGQVWTPISGIPASAGLKTVKFIDQNTGWAAGENGVILKTTNGGNTWANQSSGTLQTIRSIFFIDANIGWACGDLGTIINTSNGGANWVAQSSPYTTQFFCVRFINSSTGWIGGKGSVLLKTTNGGLNWQQQMNQGVDMWAIEMLNATTGWAAGGFNSSKNSPTLLKTTNGSSWPFQTNSGVSTFSGFNDIRFADANNGWIIGSNGTIRHTSDGGTTNWVGQNSGTQFELLGLDPVNQNIAYACGRQGVILATDNAGASWVAQSSGTTSSTLWEIDMLNASTGFAVGDSGLILKRNNYSALQPVELLQPNKGADIFQIGTRRFIIWQVQPSVSNVKIEYSINGINGQWSVIAASVPASTGSYSWLVPNTPSVNCFIRISNVANNGMNAVSQAAFYILNTPYGIDYSVLTSATVTADPPQINVSWENDVNALSYTIDRKIPSDANWTNLATLPGTTNTYTDNSIIQKSIYEYKVTKTTPLVKGYGYVYSGIEIPAVEVRGKVLLAVDNSMSDYLQPEIDQFKKDLIGDGWMVLQKNFDPIVKDTVVKNWVTKEYNKPDANVKSLIIIGHFAIPYSGNFAPDGHAERIGAQPADVYFGDVDGNWTDQTVTTTTTGAIHSPNMPGDGKWDQSIIPTSVELQVGRIDMNKMTGFTKSEADLIRQYLDKNHAYRHKITNPQQRALINTHLDNSLPSTSAIAWRSFAPMVGSNNIAAINTNGCNGTGNCNTFIDSLESNSYIWTYMAGGGSDTSCAYPVFTSSQCMSKTINTVFMQLYGSYFVEWAKGGISSTENHLLRAPLANSGMPLATCWTGGSPRWYFHHMGLGESIGFSVLQSQNNTTIYDAGNNTLTGGVHMALMGDPTLRMHTVFPVTNVSITQQSAYLQLNWNASVDENILGYFIYRSDTLSGKFTRLNENPVNGLSFTDSTPSVLSNNVYMVRAVKYETVASGSYQNMSQGIIASSTVNNTFSFIGNGNWSDHLNWKNNLLPPAILSPGFNIIIDPADEGECILDITQQITPAATITLKPGKKLRVPGALIIQ